MRQAGVFVCARWPLHVIDLRRNYNPDGIKFAFVQDYGLCGCIERCQQETCRNAKLAILCTHLSCPFEGRCGNGLGLVRCDKVELQRNTETGDYAIVAVEPIAAGEVIGEYLGKLRVVSSQKVKRERTRGYVVIMRQTVSMGKRGQG